MKLLAIDTSTEQLSVAVQHGQQVWAQAQAGGAQASATLIPVVQTLLAQAQLRLHELDALVVGHGPGAFTGLRTACSVAQGLALGAGLRVLPINTLQAVAEDARTRLTPEAPALTVLAMLDARMDEVYSAVFDWQAPHWRARTAVQVGAPQALALPEPVAGACVWCVGNAHLAYASRLPAGTHHAAWPTARALLSLAPAALAQGLAVPPEQLAPLYVRDKVAQTTAERQAAAARPAA